MRTITLSEKQQREVEILTRLQAGTLDVATAAELLGVSARQVRRRRAGFRQEGLAAVVHGNRGRQPVNRTDPALRERIVALAGPEGKYHDLNVCHLQELLEREEQIVIGRSTLDRLLKQAGLRQPAKSAPPVHRRRRLRRPAEGMLLQIDSSPFAWLEGRGAKADLLGAIDDATGKVLFLHFRPSEDQVGYLLLLRSIAQCYGLPMSIYHDRHTILRSPKQPTLEEQLAGQPPMSQVQRVMAELGIESIAAYSPQAKGRIERLWGTLQDRLTKELRLAGSSDLEQANAFLPGFIERYNVRFAQEPQDPQTAWVPLPADLDIPYYFAVCETRTVRADHCIRFASQLLQLRPGPKDPSLVAQTVTVHVVPEGEIYVYSVDHSFAL
jgi:transposase